MSQSASAPMKRRRRQMPGMPATEESGGASDPRDGPAANGATPNERRDEPRPEPGPPGAGPDEAEAAPQRRRAATGARGRARSGRATSEDDAGVNPYSGAGTTAMNVRVLVPLHVRYRKMVRDLEEEGYRASATELFQALLHFGPSDTQEARDLVRRWRALLDADPPRP